MGAAPGVTPCRGHIGEMVPARRCVIWAGYRLGCPAPMGPPPGVRGAMLAPGLTRRGVPSEPVSWRGLRCARVLPIALLADKVLAPDGCVGAMPNEIAQH